MSRKIKKDGRKMSPEAKEIIRIRAMEAFDRGMKINAIATAFGVSRQAVSKWKRAYLDSGLEALRMSKPPGRTRGGKLQPWQCAAICNIIRDNTPEQLKMPFYLWTCDSVKELIETRFGIAYSLVQVSRFLKKWGFTWQKPTRKAIEQDSEKVRKWLESDYPEIKRLARKEKAEIFWGDEMGVRSDAAPGKCYSLKGETPCVKITGRRFSCNMVSAISNRGQLYFSVFAGRFDIAVFENFLSRLIKQSGKKVFIIIDGHPVHRGKRIKAFAEENKKSIRIFFLPSYSPELNPDERLNQDVKTNAARRKRADNQKQMAKNLRSYLHSRQKSPEIVKRYFHDEPVKYAM